MRKENGNRGFTMVELIVVMAIIAVLAVILAPQYLRYVEKSRVAVDCHAAAEILEATSVAAMDEAVYKDIPETGATVVWTATNGKGKIECNDLNALQEKVRESIGDTTRSSKALKDAVWTVKVEQDPASKSISCQAEWSDKNGKNADKYKEYTEQSGGTYESANGQED